MSPDRPLVFQIRRFALDDGPGIRTTVFFKGCPLSCAWCHNPEGISPSREITREASRCIGCGECSAVCPRGADPRVCTACGLCVDACPAAARTICGAFYELDALMERLMKDRHFFRASQGGVTLSGGEPTLGMPYVGELARILRAERVHVAIQTCGYFDWGTFERDLLPHLDLVFFDLKLLDADTHRRYTGADNALILANLIRLRDARGPSLVVRTPLVPNITDTTANLRGIQDFLLEAGLHDHRLLPFNPRTPHLAATRGNPCRETFIMP